MRIALIISLIIIFFGVGHSQTCCSAGAPLVSSYGFKTSVDRPFSINLGYRHIGINRLVDNNTRLVNDPRTRENSIISIGGNYTINDRFSLGLLLPIVLQNRTTISESQSSFGAGDLTLIGQIFLLQKNDWSIHLTPAVKFPTGKVDVRSDRNIFLSPDMQSGTGSWDNINQITFVKDRIFNSSITFKTSVAYRINGTNPDFSSFNGSTGRSFKFGNELNWRTTVTREFLVGQWFVVPDLQLQVRHAGANTEQESRANNSGGTWLNQIIGLYLTRDNIYSYRTCLLYTSPSPRDRG